jgi:hypothetical protein
MVCLTVAFAYPCALGDTRGTTLVTDVTDALRSRSNRRPLTPLTPSVFLEQSVSNFPTLALKLNVGTVGVRRGVSKGVKDGRRLPALWAGHS